MSAVHSIVVYTVRHENITSTCLGDFVHSATILLDIPSSSKTNHHHFVTTNHTKRWLNPPQVHPLQSRSEGERSTTSGQGTERARRLEIRATARTSAPRCRNLDRQSPPQTTSSTNPPLVTILQKSLRSRTKRFDGAALAVGLERSLQSSHCHLVEGPEQVQPAKALQIPRALVFINPSKSNAQVRTPPSVSHCHRSARHHNLLKLIWVEQHEYPVVRRRSSSQAAGLRAS